MEKVSRFMRLKYSLSAISRDGPDRLADTPPPGRGIS